jgi:diacylglycerol O-acyltransferase
MAYEPYARLSAIDATFLALEDPGVHMHVGAVAIFEAGSLRTPHGAVDVQRIRAFVDGQLHQTPRFRQRLAWVPVVKHPIWVDDERFNINYHIRHTALPAPGEVRQLKRLAARIFSQKLDRGKPMWEMWIVEGLEDGRFAMILKAHHCMVDGIAGIDLLAAILRLDPDPTLPDVNPWMPYGHPTAARLLRDELCHRASLPLAMLTRLPRAMLDPRETLATMREQGLTLAETITAGLQPTTATPLNTTIGPYRRFDWTDFEIADTKGVRQSHGATLNDVVLATVTGAVREFLQRRSMRPTKDTLFRVLVPVSIRTDAQRGMAGNRIVNLLARLPLEETTPERRLERVMVAMSEVKRSRIARGAEQIEEFSNRTFTGVIVQLVRLAATQRTYNLVVTNVPGPRSALYLLGARMAEIYPLVPLFTNQGLGIALFSYDGRLFWGFNADWDTMPDLHEFVTGINDEFQRLRGGRMQAAVGNA